MKSFSEGEEVKIPGNGQETRETWQGHEAHLHGSLVQVKGNTKQNIIKKEYKSQTSYLAGDQARQADVQVHGLRQPA